MTGNIRIDYSKKFDKQLRKVPLEVKVAFRSRLSLFIKNKFYPSLNNHALSGKLKGFRSINVTGDWRAIYSENTGKDGGKQVIFELLGTHSQLYK